VKNFSLESLTRGEIPVLDQLRKSRALLKFEEGTRGANMPSHGGELNSSGGLARSGQRRRGISSGDGGCRPPEDSYLLA